MTVNHLVFSANTTGGIVTIGNSLGLWGITEPPIPNASIQGATSAPWADGIGSFTTVDATKQYASYPGGTTIDWSSNSSSALLIFPTGSTILSAWLFYGAVQVNSVQDVSSFIDNAIGFTPPSGDAPISVTPENVASLMDASTQSIHYHARADVTSFMKGSGYYTISGISGCLGQDVSPGSLNNMYAGWTLVVAFQNPLLPTRSLRIWDLFNNVSVMSSPVDIPVTGFTTPPMGFPLAGKLFLSAAEGDNYITGDQVLFGPNTASLTALSGPNNLVNNFFQSQINDDNGDLSFTGTFGSNNVPFVTSGGTPPTSQSGRYGWDKTAVNISNTLMNNQTSAVIRLTTTQDSFFPQALALQIDLLSTMLLPTKTSSQTTASVGDIITYTIQFTNISGISYVSGSISANVPFIGDPATAIILTSSVTPNATVTITFDVSIDETPTPNPFTNIARVNYVYIPGAGLDPVFDSADTNPVTITVA